MVVDYEENSMVWLTTSGGGMSKRSGLIISLGACLLLFASLVIFGAYRLSYEGNNGPASKSTASAKSKGDTPMILIFSKTAGYRHASIENGIAAIKQLATTHHVEVQVSEDAALFTAENLARYRAVIFLNTSGNIFDDDQKAALKHYIHAGGGYVGVHAASDTEHDWPWYGQLVGAFFTNHPQIAQATVHVDDPKTSSTSMLPAQWVRTDEWYNFQENPRGHVHVLLTVDEKTYQGGTMGSDHPLAWYHDFEGGRSWYTAMGHTPESYSEPLFLAHLWGGISYAANLKE